MFKLLLVMGILSNVFGCGASTRIDSTDRMTYFSLRQADGMARFSGYNYLVEETKDGKVHFLFDEAYPREKEFDSDDHSVFDSLQAIVMKYKMYGYSGDYQPPVFITDGGSWHLYVKYESGKSISASGYMHGPSGYRAAFKEVRECLDRWKATPVEPREIASFLYVYGKKKFDIQRGDLKVVLTYDDEETGEHQVFEKDLEMLEDLHELLVVYQLRTNDTSVSSDPNATIWSFDVRYGNGEHYFYQSYDTSFKCGYTEALHGFFSHWVPEINMD